MTNQVAEINQKKMTTNVLSRIEEMKTDGLALPKNYNASNALNVAFLELVDMKVRNQPLLDVVTQKSVYQSLLNMVLQGLSPAKNQVYFIPYGNELQMQRSYFGTQTALKRLSGVKNIWAEVIRKDETFEFENDAGRKRLTKHEQSFETLDNEIMGAYAVIDTEEDGQLLEVMTKKQIDAAWSQAKSSHVHNKFGDQMAMRTVINRAAKNYINTSDDSDLLVHAINNTTENEYDEEKRRKDVTEVPTEAKSQSLAEKFKQQKEVTPEPKKEETKEVEIQVEEIVENDEDVPFTFGEEPNEYADFEEVEQDKSMTVTELKAELDVAGVKYDSNVRKPELEALFEATRNGGEVIDQPELF